jgi:hypothetical protein
MTHILEREIERSRRRGGGGQPPAPEVHAVWAARTMREVDVGFGQVVGDRISIVVRAGLLRGIYVLPLRTIIQYL